MNQQKKDIIDNFLKTLHEIVKQHSSIIKTQVPRLHKLWDQLWGNVIIDLPPIRSIDLDDQKFILDIKYRIQILRTLQHAMNDGYFVVQTIVSSIFNQYITSDLILHDFDEIDIIPVKFLISEILIGSLLQFIALDQTSIPICYILIAKNKALMKIKPISVNRIVGDLKKNGFCVTDDEVFSVLNTMIELGYVIQDYKTDHEEILYKFVKDFFLSISGQQKFNKKIKPVLEWTIALWRSLYNIRSIDTPIPIEYPYREFLEETVKRAATQGYLTAHNVVENIANYYQIIVDNKLFVP